MPESEYIRQLIARAQSALDSPLLRASGEEEQAVTRDQFDLMDWETVKSTVPGVRLDIEELWKAFNYVPHFYEDLYNLLHQGDPLLREEREMDPRFKSNFDLATEFQAQPETEGLRLSTRHDSYATAMAILSMKDRITQAYRRMQTAEEKRRQAEEKREQARQIARALRDALDALEAMPQGEEGSDEEAAVAAQAEVVDGLAQELLDALGEALGLSEDERAAISAMMPDIRSLMRSAAQQAAQEREEEQELMHAWGLEDGELRRMDFEERRKLAERLRNNRLAKFAKLIGQFRLVGDAERRRKVQHKPDQVVGVELGSDLTRMTAGEMLNIASPEVEDDFWRRYASGELIQYKLEGTERLGKGPIIIVCDESGSMAGGYGYTALKGGSPEAWSKALSLALCDSARRQNRDFIYIGFSSPNQQWRIDFPKGKGEISKVIEFTEHFYGGGTYYETPLRQAMKIVEEYGARDLPKPDIVFISDDEYGTLDADFLHDWQVVKKDTSMRCYGIAIGCSGEGAMSQVSDDVREITTLTSDPQNMAYLFRTI